MMTLKTTKNKSGRQIACKIHMLDDQELLFQIDPKTTGQDLFNTVCSYIDLLETDYFGLEYLDSHRNVCWLELDKPVLKQVREPKFSFCVKFYTPDPGQLEEEFTRYLFALQIKRDIASGVLLCSDSTVSLLVSYIVQAEIGDYLDSYHNEPSYFNHHKYFPHQTNDHEVRIMNFHKNHLGQCPADADLHLLDISRKVELYGIKMHLAKDHEHVHLNLSVSHVGILVFQNITKINTFSWAKIRKLSFRRKKVLIKLQLEGYGYYKDTIEFHFDTRSACKNFWKKCIEHHTFFRCATIRSTPRSKTKFLAGGSTFRYRGRTQQEIVEHARANYPKKRVFTRSYSTTRAAANKSNRSYRSPRATIQMFDAARPASHQRIQTDYTGDITNVYQQVHYDDSSTHGSRTLDSKFSRDKSYVSEEQDTDADEDEYLQKSMKRLSSTPMYSGQSSDLNHTDNDHIVLGRHSIDNADQEDSATSLSTSTSLHLQSTQSQIKGFINNNRSVLSITGNTSSQKPSVYEKQLDSATHRLSCDKVVSNIASYDNEDLRSSKETTVSSMLSSRPSPQMAKESQRTNTNKTKTRIIPIVREHGLTAMPTNGAKQWSKTMSHELSVYN